MAQGLGLVAGNIGDELSKLAAGLKRSEQPIVDFGCPRCGGWLMLRQGPFGDFLGCSSYPECQYTESCAYRVLR